MLDARIALLGQSPDFQKTMVDGIDVGQGLRKLVVGRKIGQMNQLASPEEKQAFIQKNNLFGRELYQTLKDQEAAAAKAENDRLVFNADLAKKYAEIGKIGSETGEIDAKTGKLKTDTGITLQNNTGSIWSAFLTGGPNAAKSQLENMKNNGVISPESYQAELNALSGLNGQNATVQQQYALGRFKSLQDPKYSLTTADNVLDNQTSVDNNVRDNNTSTNNNIRSTNAQIYGIDTNAATADKNRQVQVQRLEFDQQQAEIKNGQGEIKEANGKLWIVYKDGTARPAVDANGAQLSSSNNQQNKAITEETARIRRVDTLLPEIEKLLRDPGATGSRVGNTVDTVAGWAGKSTKGQQISASLGTLSGQLVALMPRMEGPQSNIDVEMYKEMAGRLGDPNIPIQTRLSALQTIRQLNEKYKQLNSQSSGQLQPGQVPSSGAGGRPPLSSFFN